MSNIESILKNVSKELKKQYKDDEFKQEIHDLTKIEFLSTGHPGINTAFSGKADGGFPIGLISELSGANACVTGDTIVEIDDGKLNIKALIEKLSSGDRYNIKTPAGFQPIDGYALKGMKDTYRVELDSGESIRVTDEHRFFKSNTDNPTFVSPSDDNSLLGEWVCTKDLLTGDCIYTELGSREVVSIEPTGEQEEIFDVYVGHECHSFYGNGILNHNTGKSLLAMHALVETQKRNGVAILLDVEGAYTAKWFKSIGGDPDKLIKRMPDHIDEAYAEIKLITETVRKSDKDVLITFVYDSTAASQSKAEFDGAEYDMAKRAQGHAKGLRMLMRLCKRENITFIGINQLRATMNLYGPEKDTVGGEMWKYAPSLRAVLKKGKRIEVNNPTGGKKIVGIHGSLEVIKSRLRDPFAKSDFDIYFANGIDPISGLFEVLVEDEIIQPRKNESGGIVKGWWEFPEGNYFQKTNFNKILEEYPELLGGHEMISVPENTTITAEDMDDEDRHKDDDEIDVEYVDGEAVLSATM